MKKNLLFICLSLFSVFAFSQVLTIQPEDLLIVPEAEGAVVDDGLGYHLFIKKTGDIQSVMLAESTADPDGKIESLAYRAENRNEVNGDEIHSFYGILLGGKYSENSFIATKTETVEKLGECFHIYISRKMIYGYQGGRSGETEFGNGTLINIRAFEKPFCDYSGEYSDNPFEVQFVKLKRPKVEPKKAPKKRAEKKVIAEDATFKSRAEESFARIAAEGAGDLNYSFGANDLPNKLENLLDALKDEKKVDIVFAIDATGSMDDDIYELKYVWLPMLRMQAAQFEDLRVALLFYKDYEDEYNDFGLPVKKYDFVSLKDNLEEGMDTFSRPIKNVDVYGGGDNPEAVYEALYASLKYYDWRNDAVRKIILIGDAEPHPTPRGDGTIGFREVMDLAEEMDVTFEGLIIMPESYREEFEREGKSKIKPIDYDKKTPELLRAVDDIDY